MAAKLPVDGETTTCSHGMGYNPYLMSEDEYTGAYLAVVESVSKLVAMGFEHKNFYLTFQEYFEKLRDDPKRWGRPTAALLGALMAQLDLGIGSIGGKDSMSASFEDLDVPPTLCLVCHRPGQGRPRDRRSSSARRRPAIAVVPEYADDGITPTAESLSPRLTTSRSSLAWRRARGERARLRLHGRAMFKMCVATSLACACAPSSPRRDCSTPRTAAPAIELAQGASCRRRPKGVTVAAFGQTLGGSMRARPAASVCPS